METESPSARELGGSLGDLPAPSGSAATLATQFDLLSDPSRLQIIQALAAATAAGEMALPFSDLCGRTDIEDTGQFNYHLNRLRGTFVEKDGAGYSLTQAGIAVGRLLLETDE